MSDLKKYFSDLKTVENKLMMTKNLDIFMHYNKKTSKNLNCFKTNFH